jgi:hypothetical protein
MVRLLRGKLTPSLAQAEGIAGIRARVIQNAGYPNCSNIAISFEILPSVDFTNDLEVHPVRCHRACLSSHFEAGAQCPLLLVGARRLSGAGRTEGNMVSGDP